MGSNNLLSALVFNPIDTSLYSEEDILLTQPIPPSGNFIIDEDEDFILSESGDNLITE